MSLSIHQYRCFLYVAETGSFRAAAVRAHRSQPAVSLAIKEMESELGQQLFERGNPITLTPYGRTCLDAARRLVDHADDVYGALASLANSQRGQIRLASVATFATHWMPQIIEIFRHDYPDVRLHIYDDNSEGVERMVLQGQVDLGVCSVVTGDRRLAFAPLFEDEFGLVCHRSHPLAGRPSVTWREISSLPHIGTVAHRQLEAHKAAAFLMSRTFYVSNMMSMLAMLSRDMGVTVLARLGVPPGWDDLAFVPLVRPRIKRRLGIMKLAEAALSPPAQIMEQLLMREAGEPVREPMRRVKRQP
ncbi:LysR family transcriptional regulator [Pusillimonas sp. TS35]|nr:LysR family transcriptional regulator [Pusillimonas sp. TS35]